MLFVEKEYSCSSRVVALLHYKESTFLFFVFNLKIVGEE
jgi:hypothetical protein